jgi:DNA-binding CsgD family transcriptional regulator
VYFGTYNFNIEPSANRQQERQGITKTKESFTKKEKRIMPLMAKKHTSAEIASQLNVSTRTVEWHHSNILHKTNSKNFEDFIFWYNVNFAAMDSD